MTWYLVKPRDNFTFTITFMDILLTKITREKRVLNVNKLYMFIVFVKERGKYRPPAPSLRLISLRFSS